jgi:hypothetical protein
MKRKLLITLLLLWGHSNYTMDCCCVDCACVSCGKSDIVALMEAVTNNNLKEIQMLFAEKEKKSQKYAFAEIQFIQTLNPLYIKDWCIKLIQPMVDLNLKIETNNMLYPNNYINCHEALIQTSQARQLKDALLIDKMIENITIRLNNIKVNSVIEYSPIIALLNRPPIKRTIKSIFASDEEIKKKVPIFISRMLIRFEY